MKKLKQKYGDQDDEDRKLMMELAGAKEIQKSQNKNKQQESNTKGDKKKEQKGQSKEQKKEQNKQNQKNQKSKKEQQQDKGEAKVEFKGLKFAIDYFSWEARVNRKSCWRWQKGDWRANGRGKHQNP